MTTLRKFGLELETFNPAVSYARSGANIAAAIRGLGFSAVRSDRHFDANYDVWQIKPDVSLSPAGFALEVVSPTLPGTDDSIEQVRKVADWLVGNGYEVNQSMGYHIHIDAGDLTAYECAAVALRYHHCQQDIDAILPPSRRNSRWSARLSGGSFDKVRRTVENRRQQESWSHGERYAAVNLQHVAKRRDERRMEFRQHSGTLNADKIIGWYKFLCEFVAETLRLLRANDGSVTPAPIVTSTARPIIRGQRVRNGRTRSVVVGTTQVPRMPMIEAGTDYDMFLNAIAANGVVTQADARGFGWPETRLRVTAHWLRRNGADLITTQRNGELAYVGREGAMTREAIFTQPAQIRQRVEALAAAARPVAPIAPAIVAGAQQYEVMQALSSAPVLQGCSDSTVAWFNARRSAFAGR